MASGWYSIPLTGATARNGPSVLKMWTPPASGSRSPSTKRMTPGTNPYSKGTRSALAKTTKTTWGAPPISKPSLKRVPPISAVIFWKEQLGRIWNPSCSLLSGKRARRSSFPSPGARTEGCPSWPTGYRQHRYSATNKSRSTFSSPRATWSPTSSQSRRKSPTTGTSAISSTYLRTFPLRRHWSGSRSWG